MDSNTSLSDRNVLWSHVQQYRIRRYLGGQKDLVLLTPFKTFNTFFRSIYVTTNSDINKTGVEANAPLSIPVWRRS